MSSFFQLCCVENRREKIQRVITSHLVTHSVNLPESGAKQSKLVPKLSIVYWRISVQFCHQAVMGLCTEPNRCLMWWDLPSMVYMISALSGLQGYSIVIWYMYRSSICRGLWFFDRLLFWWRDAKRLPGCCAVSWMLSTFKDTSSRRNSVGRCYQ